MATSLTLGQTISIATRNAILPLRASSLNGKIIGQTTLNFPLSLKTVRDTVEAQQTLFVLQIRDSSLLSASTSLADLQQKWISKNPAWVPTRQSLMEFFGALDASGIVVKKLSSDW